MVGRSFQLCPGQHFPLSSAPSRSKIRPKPISNCEGDVAIKPRIDQAESLHGSQSTVAYRCCKVMAVRDEIVQVAEFRILQFWAIFLVVIGTTACETGSQRHPELPLLEPLAVQATVNIAHDAAASDAGFFIAAEKGYFEEVGIEVKFVQFPSGAEMLPMVAADQVQVAGGVTSTALFNAIDRKLGVRLLGDKGHNIPGRPFATMVLRQGLADQVKEVSHLKGRKIGTASIQSSNEYSIDTILASGGLQKSDVEIVVLDTFTNLTLALSTAAIDAAWQVEPFITIGIQKQVFKRFVDMSQILPSGQFAVLLGSPAFSRNLELSGRFMVAYLRGVRDYVDTFTFGKADEEIYRILTTHTDLKEADHWRRVNVPGLNPNGYFFKEDVRRQIQWFKENGYYEGTLDIDEVTDYASVDFALQVLGRYRYPIDIR